MSAQGNVSVTRGEKKEREREREREMKGERKPRGRKKTIDRDKERKKEIRPRETCVATLLPATCYLPPPSVFRGSKVTNRSVVDPFYAAVQIAPQGAISLQLILTDCYGKAKNRA